MHIMVTPTPLHLLSYMYVTLLPTVALNAPMDLISSNNGLFFHHLLICVAKVAQSMLFSICGLLKKLSFLK